MAERILFLGYKDVPIIQWLHKQFIRPYQKKRLAVMLANLFISYRFSDAETQNRTADTGIFSAS